MGLQWESGGHENPIKTREFGGMYFHLKGQSWPGPTKLSVGLGAEWGHRDLVPGTAGVWQDLMAHDYFTSIRTIHIWSDGGPHHF